MIAVRASNPLGLPEEMVTGFRIIHMKNHPEIVWFRSWATEKAIHVRVIDCEMSYDEGYITHLVYHLKEMMWSGTLRYMEATFILNSRQAAAMFEGMFDWLIDWCPQNVNVKKSD